MKSFKTHLTVLESSAAKYASSHAFKIPKLDPRSGRVQAWQPITYREVQLDVELFSKYWARALRAQKVPRKSVVGIWCADYRRIDVIFS
jgi:hypothetical protein